MIQCTCTAWSYFGEEQCVWCGLQLDRQPLKPREKVDVRPQPRQRESKNPPFWEYAEEQTRSKLAKAEEQKRSELAIEEEHLEITKKNFEEAKNLHSKCLLDLEKRREDVLRAEAKLEEARQSLQAVLRPKNDFERRLNLLDKRGQLRAEAQRRLIKAGKLDAWEDILKREVNARSRIDNALSSLKSTEKQLETVIAKADEREKAVETIRNDGVRLSQQVRRLRQKLQLEQP